MNGFNYCDWIGLYEISSSFLSHFDSRFKHVVYLLIFTPFPSKIKVWYSNENKAATAQWITEQKLNQQQKEKGNCFPHSKWCETVLILYFQPVNYFRYKFMNFHSERIFLELDIFLHHLHSIVSISEFLKSTNFLKHIILHSLPSHTPFCKW